MRPTRYFPAMMLCCVCLAISTAFAEPPSVIRSASNSRTNVNRELEALRGTWLCVEALRDGKRVDNFVGVRAVFDGNNMTWIFPRDNGQDFRQQCKFEIDVDQNPRHFDWHAVDKPKERKLRLYKIEDGMLYWATNISTSNRPSSFDDSTWVFRCRKMKSNSASTNNR